MKSTTLDVIVVGAGFAGLSISYYLKKYGLNHVIFERGKIGESWRSQRWDSFKMNSTNKLNEFPGVSFNGDVDAFSSASEFVSSFEQYVLGHQLPVLENSKVISIEKPGEFFHVTVSSDHTIKNYSCRQVIIASGNANEIKIPSFAQNISTDIQQLHTSQYRNPDQLPSGAVLVVGGAQSGVQIAEDLVDAGKKVYLSTSMVARIPRWYRGRDIFYWLIDIKFFETRTEEIEDLKMLETRNPQVSGAGTGKDSVSLQSLAKKGVVILGKADNADQHNIFLQPNAAAHVKFADEFSKNIKEMIDGFIVKNHLSAPPPHEDEADKPDVNAACASSIASLNLSENNISSIIWSTGFSVDFGYIKPPVFDSEGKLKHKDGIPTVPGLYFVGYPWLRSRKSSIIFGIKDDAEFIAAKVYSYSVDQTYVNSMQ
ncbi:MAG TPA: NAD(P)/FAD-dependent oxidoreductase [Chitinophagaceae bacterium]|jgi:putative flavoprotein involved in K+ transport|nr:NAD(P)/FAD-dependent oxidoreductase [Chitinophagaceae bacterium]